VKREPVDWSEPPLQRWLGTITRPGTRAIYKSGYRLYAQFTGKTATELIDEAIEDQKKDPRERTDIVKRRLIGFYNWLVNEAPKRRAGRPRKDAERSGKIIGKGLGSKIAHTYVNAIRSFYGTFDVYVKLRGRSSLPRPKVKNRRMIVSNVDVKRLADHAGSPRDRAIILTMFQSGMDVSTLCSLKYGDVAEGLERNEHPLKLDLYRPKSGTEYYTFLGRDACEAIRAYLNDLKAKGITLSHNDPLFLKEGMKTLKKEGITPNLVQNMMRKVAFKAGFIDENLNGRDFNPLSPHALRESFGSIMTNKGVPDTIVDFWLGHEIGEMAEAYKTVQFEDLKGLYMEKEAFISVLTRSEATEKLKEMDERNRQLQEIVNGLTRENLRLRERLEAHERRLRQVETLTEEFKRFLSR